MTAFSMHRRPQPTSPPRRDSEMSLRSPPSAGKALRYFMVFPSSILDLICVYLDGTDIKNLSLTCFGILDKVELTRELCPKIRMLNVKSQHQVQTSSRILPASLTELTLPSCPPYLMPEEDIPPEYFQLARAAYHNAFRIQRMCNPITVQAWLCPHVGLTANEAFLLRRQRMICEGRIRDTTPAICPFPKCSLWARHALVESSAEEHLYELCSAIKVCRFSCSKRTDASSVLTNRTNQTIFNRAMKQLHLPLCSHLSMRSEKVVLSFQPNNVAVLDANVDATGIDASSTLAQLADTIDQHQCETCHSVGTYTTWGFTGRFISEANGIGNWLDIELLLCRPLYSSQSVGSPRSAHWRHHSTRFPQEPEFVQHWWNWAEVVAEAGFDWRARLPAQYLLRSQGQMTAFPVRPPRYTDITVTPRKGKFGSFGRQRRRPRQILGMA